MKLQCEKVLRGIDEAFKNEVVKNIASLNYVVPEKPSYEESLKLASMLENMAIYEFEGFKAEKEKDLAALYQKAEDDVAAGKKWFAEKFKGTTDKINLLMT